MAKRLGYFRDAGLDVSINAPSDPSAPIKQVAAGQVDLAISYEPEVLLAHEQGLDVVAVGALVDRPLTSMIWLKESGIKRRHRPARQDDRHRRHPLPGRLPEDDPGPRQHVALRREDRQRRPRAAAGDRSAASADGDPRRLQQHRGRRPAGAGQEAGGDAGGRARRPHATTSWSWSPRASRCEEDPEPIRLFIAALARGTAAAERNPAAATAGACSPSERGLDPKTDRGRARRDPAAARAEREGPPLRLHEPGRLEGVHRLDARQRPDRVAAGARRRCSATTTCRAGSPSRGAPRPAGWRPAAAAIGRAKQKPWAQSQPSRRSSESLGLVLDPLGDDVERQRPGHADDRLDDRGALLPRRRAPRRRSGRSSARRAGSG